MVYAISKNEEKFVSRWYESMKEADKIIVLDTGSEDNTVKLLKSLGVIVYEDVINPWRFDVARNKSLDLVPEDTDICVCTDLDEVFNPGWRKELENSWDDTTNRVKYIYNWSLDNFNKPKVSFLYDKIHSRKNYKWVNPVHEVLKYSGDLEVVTTNKNIVLNHYPDINKSRASYLPLLELSVKEDSTNDRNLHYLGREYMYYGYYEKAINTLNKHIEIDDAWNLEKCASCRFISRCLIHLNKIDDAFLYLDKAINFAPNIREPYIEKAFLYFRLNNYLDCIYNCIKAKSIKNNELLYINEVFSNDETIDDLLSICFYYLGLNKEANFFVDEALLINPNNERIKKNKEIFT